eukprot:6214625-Pleurochrysis_carterae.AAC.3
MRWRQTRAPRRQRKRLGGRQKLWRAQSARQRKKLRSSVSRELEKQAAQEREEEHFASNDSQQKWLDVFKEKNERVPIPPSEMSREYRAAHLCRHDFRGICISSFKIRQSGGGERQIGLNDCFAAMFGRKTFACLLAYTIHCLRTLINSRDKLARFVSMLKTCARCCRSTARSASAVEASVVPRDQDSVR